MTSSSSYEMRLLRSGETFAAVSAPAVDPVCEDAVPGEIHARDAIAVEVRRPAGMLWGRVRVGPDIVLVLQPGVVSLRGDVLGLDDEFGETAFVYEEFDPDEPDQGTTLLTLHVVLRTAPAVEALYERLIADLEAVHAGLARDVVGRTWHRVSAGVAAPPPTSAEELLRRLTKLRTDFAGALDRIGAQPSLALDRRVERARWRPSDVVPAARIGDLAREDGVVIEDGAVRVITRARVLRTHVTTDIAEHRHLREGLLRLRDRAALLARQCLVAAELYSRERVRWGRAGDDGTSVYERRYLPRVRALQGFSEEARVLERAFAALVADADFLRQAGPPRAVLAPTPLFLNRGGYREGYVALREAAVLGEGLPLGDALRVRYRRLSDLYEYWCFVKVVTLLRERADLDRPEPREAFAVIDGTYRPELEPGQSFRFPRAGGGYVAVTYEPEFPPAGGRRSAAAYLASLGTGTLRPDVTVAVERPGAPTAILVLDAKSVARFREKQLFEISDYRSRIFEPATGNQPVKQVFLLHREAGREPVVNLPGYLDARVGGRDSSLLGAVQLLPDRDTAVRRVLERFLAIFE